MCCDLTFIHILFNKGSHVMIKIMPHLIGVIHLMLNSLISILLLMDSQYTTMHANFTQEIDLMMAYENYLQSSIPSSFGKHGCTLAIVPHLTWCVSSKNSRSGASNNLLVMLFSLI